MSSQKCKIISAVVTDEMLSGHCDKLFGVCSYSVYNPSTQDKLPILRQDFATSE